MELDPLLAAAVTQGEGADALRLAAALADPEQAAVVRKTPVQLGLVVLLIRKRHGAERDATRRRNDVTDRRVVARRQRRRRRVSGRTFLLVASVFAAFPF